MNNFYNTNTQENEIKVHVTELILTPLTCSTIINEVIKYLLYQKSQIPYPYNWLKSVVKKKRTAEHADEKSVNFQAERHYTTVSTAYDSLEKLMNSITSEFEMYGTNINRLLIIFGSSIHTAKEIYTIRIPSLAFGHLEENHVRINCKHQHKVMRNIVFSDAWVKAMNSSFPPTNMYVLIEKCDVKHDGQKTDLDFQLTKQYSMCSRVKNVCIHLSYDENSKHNCCKNLVIFEDLKDKENSNINDASNSNTNDTTDEVIEKMLWFQSKTFIKGFKECFINGVSATDLW
ncbi:hypothetical protein RN001_003890 [Aquatica leii]|uniref:Uncharacterized protein n=1 Tax=Aquatica leii TaxID=1421715 RepID=A0AAN7PIZ4_9COLE|nr:hypothetical protein RN001_003890 [Aquatica leii]